MRLVDVTVVRCSRWSMADLFSSNPFAPTIFLFEPFGHEVEGLSHFRDKTYAVERPVQTDDFENSTLCSDIRRKPFGSQVLRKFKRTDGQINGFVVRSLRSLDLQPQ